MVSHKHCHCTSWNLNVTCSQVSPAGAPSFLNSRLTCESLVGQPAWCPKRSLSQPELLLVFTSQHLFRILSRTPDDTLAPPVLYTSTLTLQIKQQMPNSTHLAISGLLVSRPFLQLLSPGGLAIAGCWPVSRTPTAYPILHYAAVGITSLLFPQCSHSAKFSKTFHFSWHKGQSPFRWLTRRYTGLSLSPLWAHRAYVSSLTASEPCCSSSHTYHASHTEWLPLPSAFDWYSHPQITFIYPTPLSLGCCFPRPNQMQPPWGSEHQMSPSYLSYLCGTFMLFLEIITRYVPLVTRRSSPNRWKQSLPFLLHIP